MRLERRETAPDRPLSAAMFAPQISRQTWRGCVIRGRSGRPSGRRATGSNAATAAIQARPAQVSNPPAKQSSLPDWPGCRATRSPSLFATAPSSSRSHRVETTVLLEAGSALASAMSSGSRVEPLRMSRPVRWAGHLGLRPLLAEPRRAPAQRARLTPALRPAFARTGVAAPAASCSFLVDTLTNMSASRSSSSPRGTQLHTSRQGASEAFR